MLPVCTIGIFGYDIVSIILVFMVMDPTLKVLEYRPTYTKLVKNCLQDLEMCEQFHVALLCWNKSAGGFVMPERICGGKYSL